jgi:predicted DNA-binding protein (MmcQ/YjbR family)
MEIDLDELMSVQSALVNVKMFLSEERKVDPDKLRTLVDEAYQIVMKKIDSLQQPFYL